MNTNTFGFQLLVNLFSPSKPPPFFGGHVVLWETEQPKIKLTSKLNQVEERETVPRWLELEQDDILLAHLMRK